MLPDLSLGGMKVALFLVMLSLWASAASPTDARGAGLTSVPWDVVVELPEWNGQEHDIEPMEEGIRQALADLHPRSAGASASRGSVHATLSLQRQSVALQSAWYLTMGLSGALKVVMPDTTGRRTLEMPIRAWSLFWICQGNTCLMRHVLEFADYKTAQGFCQREVGLDYPEDTLWSVVSSSLSDEISALLQATIGWLSGSQEKAEALLATGSEDTKLAVVSFLGQVRDSAALRRLEEIVASDASGPLKEKAQSLIDQARVPLPPN